MSMTRAADTRRLAASLAALDRANQTNPIVRMDPRRAHWIDRREAIDESCARQSFKLVAEAPIRSGKID
jgi:hypothetical protein